MSCVSLDKNISILLVPTDLFSEQELFYFLEDDPVFTSDFVEYVYRCKSSKRRKELLFSRVLFSYIMQTHNVNIRFYNSIKKKEELLTNNYFSCSTQTLYLSISHTFSWMAIALNLISYIGIDIEYHQRETKKVRQFFTEKMGIDNINEDISILLSLWTVYESLYKISVPEDHKKKILQSAIAKIEESQEQKQSNLFSGCIQIDSYKIFFWGDGAIPGPGSIIATRPEPQKVIFYRAKISEYKIKKPCKIDLTRLLTWNKELEISF